MFEDVTAMRTRDFGGDKEVPRETGEKVEK